MIIITFPYIFFSFFFLTLVIHSIGWMTIVLSRCKKLELLLVRQVQIQTHTHKRTMRGSQLFGSFFFFFFFHHDAEIRKNASLATVSINFNFNHPMSHGYFQIFQLILHYRSPYLTFHLFYFTIRLQIIYIYVHRQLQIVSGTTLNIHGASRRSETRIHHFTRVPVL